MANTFYPLGAASMLSGGINYTADTIKAVFVTDGYTYSAAHQFLTSLTTAGTAQTLGTKTVTGGVFDAADPDYGVITAGTTLKAIVLYKDTGVAGTSPLLAYLDEVEGLPMLTNGAAFTIPWSNGDAKIFSLMPAP